MTLWDITRTIFLETGYGRNKFLILCYHIFNMTSHWTMVILRNRDWYAIYVGNYLILWNHSNSIEKQKSHLKNFVFGIFGSDDLSLCSIKQ